jgi:cytoskeletal protein RodZ
VNQQLLEFCVKLKKERLAKRVALEDIAETTRINLKFLKAIEEGNLTVLPEIYVRIFLKKYIDCLGLDVNQALAEFDRAASGPMAAAAEPAIAADPARQPVLPQSPQTEKTTDPFKRMLPFFLGIVFVFLVGYFVVGKLMREEPVETDVSDDTPVPAAVDTVPAVDSVAAVVPVTPAFVTPEPVSAAVPVSAQNDSFTLVVHGIEKTWFMVVRDAADTLTKGMCQPGQNLTLRAARRVVVSLGRPRGQKSAVALELEGKSLGEWGVPGTSFTRVTVTKNGVDQRSLIVKKTGPAPAQPAQP